MTLMARAFTLLLTLLFAAGCSLKTGDEVPPQQAVQMNQPDLECIDPSMQRLQNYFEGTSTAEEVHAAWRCLNGAVRRFTVSVKGAHDDYYTANEIRGFVQTYYFNGKQISDPLLSDLMRLKQLLIGGDEKSVAKRDLETLRRAFLVLEDESVRLLPFIKLITLPKLPPNLDPQFKENAITSVIVSSHNLSLIFNKNSIEYSFEDMKSLLQHVGAFIGNWPATDSAITYLPALATIKEFIVGGSDAAISRTEIMPFTQRLGLLFAIQMRAKFFLKTADFKTPEGLRQLDITLDQSFSLLKTIANSQPDKTIAFAQTEQLLVEADNLHLLPKDFPRADAQDAFQLIVRKFLAGDAQATGVTLTAIAKLEALTTTFIDRQKKWQDVKARSSTRGGDSISVPEARTLWSPSRDPGTDPIAQLLARRRPATFTKTGVLQLNNGEPSVNDSGFMTMNLGSLVQGLLFETYAKKSALTQKEFSAIFTDFFKYAVDFKILEPKDKTLNESAFSEANLFTLESKNDAQLSAFEFFDYVGEVMGSGVMVERVYQDLTDNCRAVGLDYFKDNTYEYSCFRSQAERSFETYFSELPEWVRLSRARSRDGTWSDFEKALEDAARDKGASTTVVERADLTRIAMVMQYIESLYVRFDRNHDGALSYEEAHDALPLFEKTLREASGFKSENKIEALFMYILAKGHAPKSIGDKLDFILSWSRKPNKWRELVNADRNRLLSVVAAMK